MAKKPPHASPAPAPEPMKFRSLAELAADTAFMAEYNRVRDAADAKLDAESRRIDEMLGETPPQIPPDPFKSTARLWEAKVSTSPIGTTHNVTAEEHGAYLIIESKNLRHTEVDPTLHGWRLHVRVAEKDLEKAVDILLPIFAAHRLSSLKIFIWGQDNLPLRDKQADLQSRKKFVLYPYYTADQLDFPKFLYDIEAALLTAGIATGPEVIGDYAKISGSRYISYRYGRMDESTGLARYKRASAANAKKLPRSVKNPFRAIQLKKLPLTPAESANVQGGKGRLKLK